MCGGRGTRLDAPVEKPLFEVGGRPMVDHVRDALRASRCETVHAVGSPDTPETRDHWEGTYLEAPGDGYVADLQYALERVDTPVLTVATDLPLLGGDAVDAVLDAHGGGSLTVAVPAALKRRLGVSTDTTTTVVGREVAPTGLNVVDPDDDGDTHLSYDVRLAVNVNRPGDATVAEELL
ncbi:NTP transferase domain-containing protein [Halomicrococcus gelatinilyticus]|uniref:NTP transferase domain-containing protein n=1 Tax=Halomicrococcus gelatinilyticus TaxID=1702103 RepID=UPI002E104848